MKGRAVTAITAASDCATRAVVEPMIYGDSDPAGRPKEPGPRYAGKVRAHPDLALLYDQEDALWMNADLAVIFLTEEVKGIAPLKLTNAEVKEGDHIALVGYGTEKKDPVERRSGESLVSQVQTLDGGSVQFVAWAQSLEDGGTASQLERGDSGGGCFKVDDPAVLVGINTAIASNASHEAISVFTSVHRYTDWLQQQINDASSGRDPP